jgi:hypothetical protein
VAKVAAAKKPRTATRRGRALARPSGTRSRRTTAKPKLPIRILQSIGGWFGRLAARHKAWLKRRPHRSFYLTRRRDSGRSLKMPGYIAFSGQVWQMLFTHKGLFFRYFLLYAIFSAVIVGMLSQENYAALRDAINSAGTDLGASKWLGLFSGAVTGSGSTDTSQQVLVAILFLFGWLVMVWLLRQIMAGHKVKLRDGLYSAGSPVMATLAILLIILVQLLPLGLVVLAYVSLTGVGIINSGIAIENMAAWCALAVAAALTLYWLTSSFLALVIVTLPGMYPFRALRAAGDMVVGRRLRVMYRLLFMIVPILLLWALVLTPAIMLDDLWQLSWQPLVPLVRLLLTTLTLMWVVTYIYMLYRKIVDDAAPPALRDGKTKGAKTKVAKAKARPRPRAKKAL